MERSDNKISNSILFRLYRVSVILEFSTAYESNHGTILDFHFTTWMIRAYYVWLTIKLEKFTRVAKNNKNNKETKNFCFPGTISNSDFHSIYNNAESCPFLPRRPPIYSAKPQSNILCIRFRIVFTMQQTSCITHFNPRHNANFFFQLQETSTYLFSGSNLPIWFNIWFDGTMFR